MRYLALIISLAYEQGAMDLRVVAAHGSPGVDGCIDTKRVQRAGTTTACGMMAALQGQANRRWGIHHFHLQLVQDYTVVCVLFHDHCERSDLSLLPPRLYHGVALFSWLNEHGVLPKRDSTFNSSPKVDNNQPTF